jgi:2'-5' RNA ligase
MFQITNPKIASIEPRWAPFNGFSLLFDNPGQSVSSMGRDWLKVHCRPHTNPELELYRSLTEFLHELDPSRLTNAYLFCPLPPYSYHVTVWDGLNVANAPRLPASYRPQLERFLANLPESLLTDDQFTVEVYHSPLLAVRNWSITFRLDRLAKWGNRVLVARLKPADSDSERELERIVSHRVALYARYRERLQVEMERGYSPHVTLGYFANEERAELATPEIDRWNAALQQRTHRQLIRFSSISLYAFTNMASFFKRA